MPWKYIVTDVGAMPPDREMAAPPAHVFPIGPDPELGVVVLGWYTYKERLPFPEVELHRLLPAQNRERGYFLLWRFCGQDEGEYRDMVRRLVIETPLDELVGRQDKLAQMALLIRTNPMGEWSAQAWTGPAL